jgi:hypothetical protein
MSAVTLQGAGEPKTYRAALRPRLERRRPAAVGVATPRRILRAATVQLRATAPHARLSAEGGETPPLQGEADAFGSSHPLALVRQGGA